MTAAPRFDPSLGNRFRQRNGPGELPGSRRYPCEAAAEEERREVLECVRDAMRQKGIGPARRAACRFLAEHLSPRETAGLRARGTGL